MIKVGNGPSMPQGIYSLLREVRHSHKVFHSDLWLWAQGFTEGRLHGPGGKASHSTTSLRETAKIRLIPCPCSTFFTANTKDVHWQVHRKHYAPLFFSNLSICLLTALGNTSKAWTLIWIWFCQGLSHCQLLRHCFRCTAKPCRLPSTSLRTMPEETEEAPIATSHLGTWGNTDVTTARRLRNIAIWPKGLPPYKDEREAQWDSGAWKMIL